MTGLFANAAQAVITPPVGIRLLGTLQASTGVHDDLYARAVVLNCGPTRVAVVSLDLVGLGLAIADKMRLEIERRTGIDAVLLNCTHNHSAPFTVPWSLLGWQEFLRDYQPWLAELTDKVVNVVERAAGDLRPAELRAGRAEVQVGANRRLAGPRGVAMAPNPRGPVVPWVDVLRVDERGGS